MPNQSAYIYIAAYLIIGLLCTHLRFQIMRWNVFPKNICVTQNNDHFTQINICIHTYFANRMFINILVVCENKGQYRPYIGTKTLGLDVAVNIKSNYPTNL